MVLTTGFNLVGQALGNRKPAKSSRVNDTPLEKELSEEGEREEGQANEEEEEKEEDTTTCTHIHFLMCCCWCHRGCLDVSKMAPWCPATFGLLGTEAALSFLSLSA